MENKAEEYLGVDSIASLKPFKDCAGLYLTKFFTEMRDNAKFHAVKCPECKRLLFPPSIVCAFCKVKVSDEWVELSDKGTVVSSFEVLERERDRVTGEIMGVPYLPVSIRLDGTDEFSSFDHFLEEADYNKVHKDMRVQAVWKPREERQGKMSDIKFFRIIEE